MDDRDAPALRRASADGGRLGHRSGDPGRGGTSGIGPGSMRWSGRTQPAGAVWASEGGRRPRGRARTRRCARGGTHIFCAGTIAPEGDRLPDQRPGASGWASGAARWTVGKASIAASACKRRGKASSGKS